MTSPTLRRRDLLKGTVALVAGYGALKAGVRLLRGPAPALIERDPARLTVLSPALEAVVTAAALAFNGAVGEAAYHDQGWDPAADVDALAFSARCFTASSPRSVRTARCSRRSSRA